MLWQPFGNLIGKNVGEAEGDSLVPLLEDVINMCIDIDGSCIVGMANDPHGVLGRNAGEDAGGDVGVTEGMGRDIGFVVAAGIGGNDWLSGLLPALDLFGVFGRQRKTIRFLHDVIPVIPIPRLRKRLITFVG